MKRQLDHDRVLDLHAKGHDAREIAFEIGHSRVNTIGKIISTAQRRGDPRAFRAIKPVQAPARPAPLRPLLCPLFGIESTSRTVANRISLGSSGPVTATVSVARLRCLEGVA